jgi:uncharacterized protein YggU (UPF0235/DUF167 family)
VRVRVTPKASKNAIGAVVADEQGYGVLKVAVTAIPEKSGANAAVIGMLAKAWRLRKTDMTISRGHRDRNKTILIAGADKETLTDLEVLVGISPKGTNKDG